MKKMEQFDALMGECDRLVKAEDYNSDHWEAMFRRFLARPGLSSGEVRQALEARLVRWFAGGWQPGSDLLLGAAAREFGWNEGGTSLLAQGEAGALVGKALGEFMRFREQETPLLNMQWAAIRHMREGVGKDGRRIRRTLTYYRALRERSPAWLHMAAGPAAIAEWAALEAKAPAELRREFKDARGPMIVQWGFVLALVVFVIYRLSLPKPPERPRFDHYVAQSGDFKPNRDWINGIFSRIQYRADGKAGAGVYKVHLTKLGNVEQVSVEKSSGDPAFDAAAMAAIRQSPGAAADIARTFTLTLHPK